MKMMGYKQSEIDAAIVLSSLFPKGKEFKVREVGGYLCKDFNEEETKSLSCDLSVENNVLKDPEEDVDLLK